MNKGIHMASFFAGHVILDIKAFHFSGEMRREGTSVKLGNSRNT